jgi:caa(3)-type oxidase subunit IV
MANIPQFTGETDFRTETEHHAPQTMAALLPTLLILSGLAVAAIMVGYTVSGPGKVWVSLGLSFVQAGVLCYFFMDLRRSDRLTWLSVGAAIFWTVILFTITLTDFLTRHYWAH